MKKFFLVIIAASLICMQTVTISAVSNEEELQAKSSSNTNEIASKEIENDSLIEQITDLNNDIESTRLEIAHLQQDIDKSNATVKELNSDIEDNKEKLKERIRSIYMAGSASNLEVIIGAKSFDDLLDKLQYVSVISKHDSALISNLSDKVNTNKQTQKTLTASKKDLEEKSKSLKAKRISFEDVLKANKDRLNYLYSENQSISDMLSIEEDAGYAALEDNIKNYYNGLENSAENETQGATSSNKNNRNSSTSDRNSNSSSTQTQKPTKTPQTNSSNTNTGNVNNSSSNNNDNEYDEGNQNISDITPSGSGYVWPVPGFYHLTSLWDEDRGASNHGALDIASGGIEGANVVASRAGTIVFGNNDCIHNWGKDSSCGCGGGYGNYVMIDHGDGHMTVYAHMSSLAVSIGDYVQAGQLLGFVGSTGYSTGAHLHFETRYNGEKYNPLDEFPEISVTY